MEKKTVYSIGLLMILVGIVSTLHFTLIFQGLFQSHLSRYSKLFDRGLMGRCLYLDVMMFLYITSVLFKNFYYVLGGILIVCFVEFGRELGLLASFIALVTEISFHLLRWEGSPGFSIMGFLLFIIGIAIPLFFIYFLTRHALVECLKNRIHPKSELSRASL